MPKRRPHSGVLLLITGWLVLLASGDDLNFTRLMLPSTDSPLEETVPLDDPNCDFTESATMPTFQQGEPSERQNLSRTASRHLSTPLAGFRTRTDRLIPLRC